jgi:hypothetical protein
MTGRDVLWLLQPGLLWLACRTIDDGTMLGKTPWHDIIMELGRGHVARMNWRVVLSELVDCWLAFLFVALRLVLSLVLVKTCGRRSDADYLGWHREVFSKN